MPNSEIDRLELGRRAQRALRHENDLRPTHSADVIVLRAVWARRAARLEWLIREATG